MKIKATFLWSSGSNPAGNFYIGVLSDLAPITLSGTNNVGGQVRHKISAAVVDKIIQAKKKTCNEVGPSEINDQAIKKMIEEIIKKIPKLRGVKYTLSKDGIDFASSGIPPRPKRSNNRDHFWL